MEFAGFDAREVQQVADQAGEAISLARDDREEFVLLLFREIAVGESSRISVKLRIEVSGVRSSCETF